MRIGHGWSGEIATNRWVKLKVELDENDLIRLLREAGLSSETQLRTVDAFRLLDAEAERLLLAKMIERYGYPEEQGRQQIADLLSAKKNVIDRLNYEAIRYSV